MLARKIPISLSSMAISRGVYFIMGLEECFKGGEIVICFQVERNSIKNIQSRIRVITFIDITATLLLANHVRLVYMMYSLYSNTSKRPTNSRICFYWATFS